jgi:type I restriction enzyme S subunit
MRWALRKLDEICSFKTGKLDSNAAVPNGDFPFFTCAQETYRIDKVAFNTEAILLGGNNAAGVYPLKYYNGEFNAYQRTYVIESLNEKLLSIRFLYFSLSQALSHFQSASIGAATQYLTKSILNNFEVALPPIAIQQRIAAILSAYDDLIENNRRRMALLEDAARQVYQEWFVRLRFPGREHTRIVDGVPEGWERKKLGDHLTLNYGKALKADFRVEGPYPVYGSSGIVGTHEKALVAGPAIILGRKGNVGSVFWSSKDFYPIDTVYFINAESSDLYLYYALKSMHFINTDVAVPGLNRDLAYSRELLLPPKGILRSFLETITSMHGQMEKLDEMNQKLRTARDLLLPKLMCGEIAV